MSDRTAMEQVKAGFRRAAAWLLVGAWIGLVCGGMAVAFTPGPPSPVVGWIMLAVAAVIFIVTMDRWIGIFAALLACGIFGGISMIVDGHTVNHPEVKISALEAVVVTVFLAASAAVSFTFTNRKLHLVDRAALFVFVFCVFWQGKDSRVTFTAMGIAFCSLLFAWAFDRLRHRHHPKHTSSRPHHMPV